MAEQRWVPLESNPDVLNKYIHDLGAPSKWQFVDVFGLDDDLLAMVPQPVVAIMLLYPLTEKVEGSPIGDVDTGVLEKAYFIRQTIRNACGTIALVHALANNKDKIEFDDSKYFTKFLESTKTMSPEDRAGFLEKDSNMGNIHEESAQEGQTQAPSREDEVNPHFVAFIHQDGGLYELDGRKEGPIRHSDSTPETLLQDTAKVLRKFMDRDPENINFAITALVQN
ncbi:ubiquitin carboxyl-terminal hydrolase-like isoform X1 [Haliotis cracherodii]|uniref:ubiquitin carboxyl-terminal hydrolase-like isoform X1 n=1 Tax=Haliotis cracherodii TaxID=6455 RepID=UPI0039EC870C